MQDRIARHAEALGVLDAIVAHVTDDDLERATPCTGWSVADLLAHELGQHLGFAAAVREGDAPESSYTSVPFTHHAWRGSVQAILEAFAGADPDAPVVERELAPVELSLRTVVDAQLLDVVAHTWDLAKGLGHDYTPPEDVAADFLAMAEAIPDRAFGPGAAFAERRAAEDADASDWEKALRLLGRDPGWSA
jgi:uncharacterized protein (TIGR03086 family)